jgi:ribosomal protein S18 acetylase RimI-like enzyme
MSLSASSTHPLDHPIWNALTSTQSSLAEGGARARRYPPAIAPLPVTAPAEFKLLLAASGEQMIGAPVETPIRSAEIITLGAADVPAMMELTKLTRPGPFTPRTHELGTFLGIRIDGQLVAMAGERMKPANYTEMTAVCVHPDYRGRGYAQMLLGAVSRQITARGEIPFLHVFTDNAAAIALYRRQGMEIRRRIFVTVLGRAG